MITTVIDNIFCGIYREYHDKEKTKIKSEVFMTNGKKEGEYKSYYKNGELHEKVNYIDGLKQGIEKSYYDNGQLFVEVNYIDDKKNGIFKSYHING